jgi:transcriptional regulator with XRE-family HTH domain
MREDQRMARFTPPTPRSRRLGREIRKLREARGWTLDQAGEAVRSSGSRIGRIETGDIKPRYRDVLEILVAYGERHDQEPGKTILEMTQELRESGWWQRLDTLTPRYRTYIAYESEARELRNFEPLLVPGLLQTEAYATEVIATGQETETKLIGERVKARMTRQEILTRKERPLRMHAILSESALRIKVGGSEVLHEQLEHLLKVGTLPNVKIQVLTFEAGAHLAIHGGFAILGFEKEEPALGYQETFAGELFLESPNEIKKLNAVFEHSATLALSPAESAKLIRERGKAP